MNREERLLANRKQDYIGGIKDGDVAKDSIPEGSFEFRYINNTLYIVAKKDNKIWYFKGSLFK